MEHQNFVLFSNTIEEYEAFINKGVFYWPNEITKLTTFQKKLKDIVLQEKVGDKVLIVVGARMKNIKDTYLKDKITTSPMITHIAKVSEVYERPVVYCKIKVQSFAMSSIVNCSRKIHRQLDPDLTWSGAYSSLPLAEPVY